MAVLYIEDNFITHQNYIIAIYKAFPGSLWVDNLNRARAALQDANRFDVILCDSDLTHEEYSNYNNTEEIGINFLRSLLQNQGSDVPILILFSVFTEQLQLNTKSTLGIHVLDKPIDPETLVKQIEELRKQKNK